MTKKEILIKLKAIKSELHHKFGIEKIALFGSYARDEARHDSDVDLLVEMKQKDYFTLIASENFLSEYLSTKTDMGFFNSMQPYIQNQIEKDIIYV